ncbi:MAG: molybdenum cofactor biosynthesis protein [Kiritimatiellaeota bacterium]|nr:molybdenum cofactor biosynthesis protein [Kiritimatiellota bacterium]
MSGAASNEPAGRIVAVCISERKGTPKTPVASARFVAGAGLEADAHAGPWHRQVSILDKEAVDRVRKAGLPDLTPGAFAENLQTEGLNLEHCGLGTRLVIADQVQLVVTQIGKTCHTPCRIARITGDCIMPGRGLFCRVERGGKVAAGDPVRIEECVGRDLFQAVVLTISDSRAAGVARDTAGPAVADLLESRLNVHIYRRKIIPDDHNRIRDALLHYAGGHSIDLVVTVGGTGFSPRDVTPEATATVVQRPTPGLDEVMRAASVAKTPFAALSRGRSGIRGRTLILNLPGSRKAAVENLQAIVSCLEHGLGKIRGDPTPCAGVQASKKDEQP